MISNSDLTTAADLLESRTGRTKLEHTRNALLSNDRDYFRAGALTEDFGGSKIVRVESLPNLSAACVVESADMRSSDLQRVCKRLTNLKIQDFRTYLCGEQRVGFFEQFGCVRTVEIGYHAQVDQVPTQQIPAHIKVRPISREDDAIKASLLDEDSARPDGKASQASDYVQLERLKIEAGYMTGYMLEVEGDPAGFFSLSRKNDLVRMKNLFSAPRMRGAGCGAAIITFARHFAWKHSIRHIGVFAIQGGAGEKLYARNGLNAICAQTEYAAKIKTITEAVN